MSRKKSWPSGAYPSHNTWEWLFPMSDEAGNALIDSMWTEEMEAEYEKPVLHNKLYYPFCLRHGVVYVLYYHDTKWWVLRSPVAVAEVAHPYNGRVLEEAWPWSKDLRKLGMVPTY